MSEAQVTPGHGPEAVDIQKERIRRRNEFADQIYRLTDGMPKDRFSGDVRREFILEDGRAVVAHRAADDRAMIGVYAVPNFAIGEDKVERKIVHGIEHACDLRGPLPTQRESISSSTITSIWRQDDTGAFNVPDDNPAFRKAVERSLGPDEPREYSASTHENLMSTLGSIHVIPIRLNQ